MCKLCLREKFWIIKHINDNNILNKKSELISKSGHLKKFLLKHVKKKQWTLVLCVFVFCIFVLNITNIFYFFLDRKDITCLMIAFAWNSELHKYFSFILPFLNTYLCSLLWFSYRPSLYIIYTYTHTLHIYKYIYIYYIYI